MSTTAIPPLPEAPSKLEEAMKKLEERFNNLKKEMEDALNKFAEGGTKLQEQVKILADAQLETAKTLKITQDEVRVIGGKLPKAPDVIPEIQDAKDELGVTLFDLFD